MTAPQPVQGADTARADQPELLPARMLNEFVYCPRLFYLEWVQGEWEESAATVEGRYHHRRVDREAGAAPTPPAEDSEDEAPIHARSVLMSSPRLRLIARIDLLEGEGTRVTPVDYKRGQVPPTAEQSWEHERVQLCAQGLVLRDNGFECDHVVLYYVGSRRRVEVPVHAGARSEDHAVGHAGARGGGFGPTASSAR